ncbi:MAG TPA: type II CAAX endopeptidase family protein [Jatrophihabitans sp.]|nr:type II CAAX endopeptidase family protein [Jatrophihabitans sp.]
MTSAPARPDTDRELSPKPSSPGLEILLVLGVSLGISAISSWINFLDIQTRGGFRHATATLNGAASPRAWVDLSYQLLDVVNGVVPALLALYLLSRTPFRRGFGIGLDRLRPRQDLLSGVAFFLLIGVPGLALVYVARKLGINAQIEASGLADVWYRYPVLVLDAIQNGVLEEIVMIGFVLTRLRQLNWAPWQAILLSAAIRGSYHTYQGVGGFVGNVIMGAIFGWWFTRTRRVLPLVIAHSLLDTASFVGYAALHGHISWI